MQIVIQNSVEKLLESLTPSELAKAIRTIDLLEEFGHELGLPHSRHMQGGLLELRVRGKREIRVFFCFHKNKAVLLHAFIKKTEQTPTKELQRANVAKYALQ